MSGPAKKKKKAKKPDLKRKFELVGLAITALTAGVVEGAIVGGIEGIHDWLKTSEPAAIYEKQQNKAESPFALPRSDPPAGDEPKLKLRYTVEHETGETFSWSGYSPLRIPRLISYEAAQFSPETDESRNAIKVRAKFNELMAALNFSVPRDGLADYVARMSGKEVPTLDLSSVARVSIAPEAPGVKPDSEESAAESTKSVDETKQA